MNRDPQPCDVCGRPCLSRATGVCARCRMGGAEFARQWMEELQAQGANSTEIAKVVGTTPATVRQRLRERGKPMSEAVAA